MVKDIYEAVNMEYEVTVADAKGNVRVARSLEYAPRAAPLPEMVFNEITGTVGPRIRSSR